MTTRARHPFVLAFAAGLLFGCNDPADWRPAQGVADLPKRENAWRIFTVANDCTAIGTVEGTSVKDVAITVANHGGTHYLVIDERVLQQYVTAPQSLAVGYSQTGGTLESTKQVRAEAYVCPSRRRGAEPGAAEASPAPPVSEPAPPAVAP
ncbi:MAG: hypothetical protein JST00_23630 [Deltaproteobacteria bacterium]|nr:hypothetical protein [Deltaproteobacteria bacterium]